MRQQDSHKTRQPSGTAGDYGGDQIPTDQLYAVLQTYKRFQNQHGICRY